MIGLQNVTSAVQVTRETVRAVHLYQRLNIGSWIDLKRSH